MLNKVKHLARIVRVSNPRGASEMLHCVQHDVLYGTLYITTRTS